MKANTITLRVTDDLKYQLEDFGVEQKRTISETMRSILEDFFNSPDNLKEIQSHKRNLNRNENIDFVQTLGFAELMFFIYEKKRDPEIIENDEFCNELINLIGKLNRHPLFTYEVRNEFNKISEELKIYLSNTSRYYNDFTFPKEGNRLSFDYELFSNFFYAIRYDEENRILNIQ